MRLPAHQLENAVCLSAAEFLRDDGRVALALADQDASQVQMMLRQAKQIADQLSGGPIDRMKAVHSLVDRIIVSTAMMRIVIAEGGIGGAADRKTTLEIPVQLKRCGMAMRLIVRSPGSVMPQPVDPKLVAIVVKARHWFAKLISGECDSIGAIADQANVTSSYVSRVMYLAFLAPDIVERIVAGKAPPDVTAERLTRIGPLPMAWDAQRKLLGVVD